MSVSRDGCWAMVALIAWACSSAAKVSASEEISKTAKDVAAECDLTDEDLKQVPSEMYDCVRHYANTGHRYASAPKRESRVEALEQRLEGMRTASKSSFAAYYVLLDRPRYMLVRDASGMYNTIKQSARRMQFVVTKDGGVAKDEDVASYYSKQSQLPGDFDRSFLSKEQSGGVSFHEEMCRHSPSDAQDPAFYSEVFSMDVLEGSWEGYLKGEMLVLRLSQKEAERRDVAQTVFSKQQVPQGDNVDESAVEALKEAAKMSPSQKVSVSSGDENLSVSPSLVYVKRDAMLWIDASEDLEFLAITAK